MGHPALYGYVESCFSLFSPFFQKIIFDLGFGWQKSFFCKWICGNILWIFLLSFFKKAGAWAR